MGSAKAALEWHGSTLLRRTVGIVGRAVDGPVVVVRAAGQPLPELPATTIVVDDPRAGKGPVQGIAAGLAALRGLAEAAFVTSTDLPFLHPAFVRRVLGEFGGPGGPEVALPVARGYQQPLAAGYRTDLAERAERLVREDRLRPAFLFDQCVVTRLDETTLRTDPLLAAADPDLDSLHNVNTPTEYESARARPAPVVTVMLTVDFGPSGDDWLGGRRGQDASPRRVRAATLGQAAREAGLPADRWMSATLNGAETEHDAAVPLVAGDTVSFLMKSGN